MSQPFTPTTGIDGKTLVLQAVDLVQLIGQTVQLKKRGRSYIGLCPFHNEKSPSFNVHPDKGFFHCFGCRESGNAIDFVIKRDGLTFADALRALAQQFNIELPRLGINRESTGLRQVLLDACSAATGFFEQNLQHPQLGKAARDYLAQRGFNEKSIRDFRIGLAPDGWDNLLRSSAVKKFKPEQLLQAGLLKARAEENTGGGFYDTFRNRLMFPIRDEAGRVIAFGGRVMPGSDAPAKYLNSPETPLFNKSRVAYGLDLARPRVVETKTVAVVEGYTDVVMAHQYGASNVISVLGTALTEQHINLLRRFADRVVLLFDGDAAGESAVDRALELFLTQPIEIGIATLPAGVDPDEYLLKHGHTGFDKLISGAEDALSFQWRQLFAQLATSENDLTGRSKAVENYLERLAKARAGGPVDPIRWGAILARVAKFTQIPADELNRRFRVQKPAFPRQRLTNSQNLKKSSSSMPVIVTAESQAHRWILGALLHLPEAWFEVQQVFDWTEFNDESLRRLGEWYWDYQRHEGQPQLAEISGLIEAAELKTLAFELAAEVEVMNNPPDTLAGALAYLEQEKLRQRDRKLVSGLRRSNDDRPDADSEIDALRQLTKAGQVRSGVRVQ